MVSEAAAAPDLPIDPVRTGELDLTAIDLALSTVPVMLKAAR
jgi:hypothetical protein